MMEEDQVKRDIVVSALNQMPGVSCRSPEGTIYAFPDISATGWKAADLAEDILLKTGVVVEAGSFYGAEGEGHLHVCFGAQMDDRLREAMARLRAFFSAL